MDLPIPYTLHGRTTIWVHTHPTQSTTGRRQPTHRPQHSPSTRTTCSTWQHRPRPGPTCGNFRPLQQGGLSFLAVFFNDLVGSRWPSGRRGPGGVHSENRDRHRPPYRRARMSDKSPRQTMTKKSGKSLKEKRAAKRGKAAHVSQTEALLHTKKH